MKNSRRNALKNLSLTGFLASFGLPFSVLAQSQKPIPTPSSTGTDDRLYWANLLYKIAQPVISNLAQGTLKKNMPLETAPGYYLKADKVTYMEAIGRTLAGIAPWLALPDDDTPEGKLRKQLRSDALKGLPRCVDPQSPDYLNFRTEQQPIVDAAFMAHAFLRAPDALWHPLDDLTKKRFVEEFKSLRDRKAYYSNWLLFSGLIESFLLQIGEQYDPVRIDIAIRKTQEWYVGDGWYSDGPKFCMDYYNSFVIQPMLVDVLKVTSEKNFSPKPEYAQALKRMARHAEFLERLISPEGTFPVFGRSITYRVATFQALAQMALLEQLPESITPAQVRCGLTKVLHNMFDHPGNFDQKGWLVLGFNGAQPAIADVYTSTGSLYLTTLGFLPLGLPASNRFWTDPPADWTSKKAWSGQVTKKDYKVDY
ncbi:DUF2264 domain-containing protein [Haliscomenobacter hydrossis]|uniref:Uncharacterized conserved protein UCP014753 n=1 Tax=Haliscomenobacter hydrossis (strain ATCC 27775 / DSM 1100 / LMG 10767 / O) TaxID=760192 RepID=F4KQ26_HALH1|nr:DUF2264 domain-containing protein [Haliscomenobacter hydrossis]AEE53230.1 Uncharacterized conserved protein UCP014753 [Haliscomenobacter hydrossis DSM 1100]